MIIACEAHENQKSSVSKSWIINQSNKSFYRTNMSSFRKVSFYALNTRSGLFLHGLLHHRVVTCGHSVTSEVLWEHKLLWRPTAHLYC